VRGEKEKASITVLLVIFGRWWFAKAHFRSVAQVMYQGLARSYHLIFEFDLSVMLQK
jgi:hypothetical protein